MTREFLTPAIFRSDVTLDDGGAFTTAVQVLSPTANRTITVPDASGTVVLDSMLATTETAGLLPPSGFAIFDNVTGTYNIDMDILNMKHRILNLTGNLTLTTSNLYPGRQCVLQLKSDATLRNLTFPTGWVFVGGAAPASIAANKRGILELTVYGSFLTGFTNSDIIARWSVQP